MRSSKISTNPVLWTDGLDIDLLALVLVEIVDRLSARQIAGIVRSGEALIAKAEQEVRPEGDAGSAA